MGQEKFRKHKSRPKVRGADDVRSPNEKKASLTECVRMFWADGGNNSARKGRITLGLRLVDKLQNTSPALVLVRRLRSGLRETFQQVDRWRP